MAYNGFSLLVADNLDRKSSSSSSMIGLRRHDWMRPICNGVCLVGLAALIAILSFRIDLTPSVGSFLSVSATEVPVNENGTTMYIEDVIDMDSDVLVVIRQKYPGSAFPVDDQSLECRYGRFTDRKATSAVQLVNHRLAVLCPAPPEDLHWDMNSIVIAVGEEMVCYPEGQQQQQPWQWFRPNKVVYEAFPTDTDVVVFLRGLDPPRPGTKRSAEEEEARLKKIQCVYGERFETAVTAAAQEVIRCAHPPVDLVNEFAGKKVSVKFEGTILPSVAYYNPGPNPGLHDLPDRIPDRTSLADAPTKHHVCSCTMIHNVAKFLAEWVYYNHHLGVAKFFLYDNGSDDDLDAVIATLGKDGFVIQKQAWPWVKTQNAGFSHCALLAQNECEWMLFTDVDEFFVPGKRFLRNGSQHPDEADVSVPTTTTGGFSGFEHSSILARVIKAAMTEPGDVGQVSAKCYNFGPSGLRASPPQGVTQGYTCRSRDTERHKSIVLLSSIVDSLENVIHHFSLKQGYRTNMMRPASAVVNHYKFQVWDEFKNKFRRRAATYVADWTEDRNHAAKDRVPDLGIKAIKPADWESRYCEVHDYGLKNYTQRVFGSHDRDNILHLPWA